MKQCPRCSTPGRDGSRICKQCGSILVEAPSQVFAPEPASLGPTAPPLPPESAPPAAGRASPLEMPAGNWRCARCGEPHAQRALVCWKCGTDAWGREDPHFVREHTEEPATVARPGGDSEAETELELHPEEVPYRAVAQCERCRSRKVMPDIQLALEVATEAEPDAMLFTRPATRKLLADICGECGHVEIKLKDPAAFYRVYLEGLQRKREARR